MKERRWEPGGPLDVGLALQPHRRGGGDPTWCRSGDGAVWRTSRTPDGPCTLRVSVEGGSVHG
ncbi:DNA-3-methyladenine glycosylase 2 family protein, partial [Nonomuraea deserti]